MRFRTTTVALCAAILLAAALAVPAGAITNGQADGKRHPYVGGLLKPLADGSGVYPTCTGTLISPGLFLTAAHCAYASRVSVSFDEQIVPSTKGLPGTIHAHPRYSGQTAYDIAVVVLDKPVKNIAPAQIPDLGFLDRQVLNDSTKFTSVGYGVQEPSNPPGGGGPVLVHQQAREFSVGSFKGITQDTLTTWMKIANGDGGTCFGDSGGPTFWGAGATERSIVVSITITGDGACKSTNVTNRMDTHTSQDFIRSFM